MNFTIVKKTVTFSLLLFAVAQICDAKSVEWALRGVDAHGEFHYGLAVFPKKNADGSMQYGAVNTNGQVAIKPTYKWLNHFNKGMAVAETIEGQRAIINVNGNILYKTEGKIAPIDIDGAFLVTNGSQTGLFYESALILPVEYKYLWSLSGGAKVVGFTRHGEGQPTYYLNLVNGKTFSFAFNYGEYVICREADSKDLCYYDKDGRELDKSRYSVSSGGVEIFKDKTKELYGLRNKKTGVVIVRPIYNKNNFVQDIWLNDVVIVSTKEKGCVVYDKYGKPVIKGHYISSIAGGYVSMADNTNSIGLYSTTGKEILPKEYSIVYADFKTGAPWFHLISKKGNNALYNVETRQMYEGSFLFNDGMFYNFKDKFYINSF
ncbi:MAG: WG repeat-containing protein, partial [Muribaculaceae bacterium]|nr:WG repeat-containing protein [Muribaculaceae bacterium]